MSTHRQSAFWFILFVAPFVAPACVADEDPCEEAGACVEEVEPPPTGDDGIDRDRSSARACGSDAQCDDGNDCTSDTCEPSGRCRFTPTDGVVLRHTDCERIVCQDRVAESVSSDRGTLCNVNQICDYDGRCVGCDSDNPCPGGYECDAGACVLPPGSSCTLDEMCLSGDCSGGACH